MPAASRIDLATRWLALAANVGVILGLVLVIVEVRQNAELTRTQMEQRKNDFLAEIEFSLGSRESAEVWVKAIRTPESLTDAEMKMVEARLLSLMLQWDHLFQMERSGLVTREHVRQHIANSAPYYFGSRFGKRWWRLQMPGWQGTSMIEVGRSDRRGTRRQVPGRPVQQNAGDVAAEAVSPPLVWRPLDLRSSNWAHRPPSWVDVLDDVESLRKMRGLLRDSA